MKEILISIEETIKQLNTNDKEQLNRSKETLTNELMKIIDKLKDLTAREKTSLLKGLKELSSKIQDVGYKPQYDIYVSNIGAHVINRSLDSVIDGINRRIKLFRDYDINLDNMGINVNEFYGAKGEEIRERDKQRISNLEKARNGLLRQKETIATTGSTKGVDELIQNIKDNINLESLDDFRTIKLSNNMNEFIVNVYQEQKKKERPAKRLTMRDIDNVVELRNIERGVKITVPSVDINKNGKDKGCTIS